MDPLLKQEVAEAGLRLRQAIARVVNETPECFPNRNDKWSFEFSNPASGERIVVTYEGPTIVRRPS
jgi:hypothetical protein